MLFRVLVLSGDHTEITGYCALTAGLELVDCDPSYQQASSCPVLVN